MKLQEWAAANTPEENLIYKNGYWDQIIFIRDTIPALFSKTFTEYEKIREDIRVISTHMSKSVLLPVFELKVSGITFTMRYNFHDWKVSVNSINPIDQDFGNLFTSEGINYVYCEGFPKEKVFDSYSNNQSKFTIELQSRYSLYTFMWIIANQKRKLNEN